MPNFINIQKLKELTNGIIKIKPLYNNISDNYTPTYRELKEGKFFNRFIDNESPNLIVVGLNVKGAYNDCYTVNDDDVELIYPKLNEISIDNIDDISPCGDDISLSAIARFNIIKKNIIDEHVYDNRCSSINPFWRSSNESFKINGTSLTADQNTQEKQIVGTLSASYIYSGTSKTDSIIIKQNPNVISDWFLRNEETDNIELFIIPDVISNRGGQSKLRVIRHYTKNLAKQDSCGKILELSASCGHMDDVTSCCQYDNTNPEHFIRNVNIITTKKQDYNDNEQTAIITANYKGFTSEAIITQEKGGQITYTYDLAFLETDNYKLTKVLDTSIATEIQIPLISNKNMLIDGVYYSSIIYENLTIENNESWCEAKIDDTSNDIILNVKITQPNHNRKQQRITTFNIINEEDETKQIQLILVQPNSIIKETVWELYLSGGGEFTNETIKEARIEFKPIRKEVYEDGTWDLYDILDNNVKVTYESESTNPNILDGGVLKRRDFNGLHDMKPKYVKNTEMTDVSLNIIGYIEDNYGDILAESKPINITLEGVVIPSYTYDLSFGDNNINNELIWTYNDLTEQYLNVKSFKNTYINGIKTKTEECEIKLKPSCEWGNDFFIKLNDKKITAKPLFFNNTNFEIENEYTIIQSESDKKIKVYLTQHPHIQKKDYDLIVKVHKNIIDENILIEDGAKLIITSENEEVNVIDLSSGWLFPDIEGNCDIIYMGNIKLYENCKYDATIKDIIYNVNACDGNGNQKRIKYENQDYIIDTKQNIIELIFEL